MVIAYKTEKINTPNKLVIDFGPKFFKSSMLINTIDKKVLTFPNSLYFISSTKVKLIERDFKDAINNLQSGVFTKQEIESAQLLLQADERFIDISSEIHIEKAYQNFFEQISEQNPFDFRDDSIDFEKWSVYLAVPYVKDYEIVLQHHLEYLKSLGFIFVKPIDYLTSSFYSQSSILGQENIKHKFGIIVNVSEFTDIGVFDEHLIDDGTSQIPLGTSTVVEYGLAFLRDLAIRGFKRDLLEEWIYEGGTCLNDSPSIMKNIRRKSIDIKALLNAPRIMFDYHSVTSMNLEVNSIQDGIVSLLNKKNKKIKKNINKILSNIIVVGPGAVYKGFGVVLKSNLANHFKADIKVITGVDPRNSEFNGLFEYLNLYEEYDVYNVTKIKLEDKQRKALEKQFSSQIKIINDFLRQINSRKLFYPGELARFSGEMKILLDEVNNLPEGLNAVIETNILKEVQKWAKEFSKQLKYLPKLSSKSLELANQSLVDINTFISIVNGFTRQWLVQLFSTQLTKVRNEVNEDKSKHETKINSSNLKIVNKILKKNKDGWILLDDLSIKSGISIASLKRIIDPILNEYRQYGFLDGRFVVFTEQILSQADKFLSDLILAIEQKIDKNISSELEEDIFQGLDYCNFLIRGYSYYEKRYQGQEILQKKEFLLEEKKNLKL